MNSMLCELNHIQKSTNLSIGMLGTNDEPIP